MKKPQVTKEAVLAVIAELREAMSTADLSLPHGVVMTDPETGLVQIYGPYDDHAGGVRAAGRLRAYHDEQTGPPADAGAGGCVGRQGRHRGRRRLAVIDSCR